MPYKNLLLNFTVSLLVATGVLFVYNQWFAQNQHPAIINTTSSTQQSPIRLAAYETASGAKLAPVDFTYAASLSTPAVVHVKKTFSTQTSGTDPWGDLFGDDFYHFFGTPQSPKELKQEATGSGVIISDDGYIVTNNHVISDADNIEVRLYDNRTYPAQLIGSDPSTDLALLKINEDNLHTMELANSDSALVGQWVLAVGNPFELTSTVTAGIISAKGRNINILREQSKAPIEAFIQTDAAVNPGNSGGALVNLNGKLIGINTAIATPTGAYAGYSFAVPVNIVKKVIADLKKYGVVQRAFLGVQIRDIDNDLAQEMDLNSLKGAYIASVNNASGADDAGLKEGDVITSVNGVSVNSVAQLQEQISRYRPGDKVSITYSRNGRDYVEMVTLKNQMNTTEVVEKESNKLMTSLGASFESLTTNEMEKFELNGGVKVADVGRGRLHENSNIRDGFIITEVDHQKVKSVDQLIRILEKKKSGDGALIEGFYPENPTKYYYYGLGM